MLSDRSIAHVVHRRLRKRNIHLHRAVVRLITRDVLDLLTEQFPKVARIFLDEYRAARHDRRTRWHPIEKVIARIYTRSRMQDRTVYRRSRAQLTHDLAEARTRLRQLERRCVELTEDEFVDLVIMRDHAVHDDHRKIIDKLVDHFRP